MGDYPALKDYFTRAVVAQIGRDIAAVHPDFDEARFLRASMKGFAALSFSGRSDRIAEQLREGLPEEIPAALKILTAALPPRLEGSDDLMSQGFSLWPFGDFIKLYASGHFKEGMQACYELTQRFSSEFAIRPLLKTEPDRALKLLKKWSTDPNEHVRRLCSEGSRPRLPWSAYLSLDPEQVLPILEQLKADPSLYVRRSVANHLNDLDKEHPELVLPLLETWYADGGEDTRWVVRHALRNRLKQGHPRALALLGYHAPKVAVRHFKIAPKKVPLGDWVTLDFELESQGKRAQKLMIDLVVHYQKKGGKCSPKVFKFKNLQMKAGAVESFSKRLQMVNRSTRKLHAGEHAVEIQINGKSFGQESFELLGAA